MNIQNQIEQTVTNGRGYTSESPHDYAKSLSWIDNDTALDVQIQLGMMDVVRDSILWDDIQELARLDEELALYCFRDDVRTLKDIELAKYASSLRSNPQEREVPEELLNIIRATTWKPYTHIV